MPCIWTVMLTVQFTQDEIMLRTRLSQISSYLFCSGRVFLVLFLILTFTGWRYWSGRPIMDKSGVGLFLVSSIVITRVSFILLTIMSFMNGLNTSRLIVILSGIILSMVLSSFSPSPPKINLQISSPSYFLRVALVIWLTTSSWSYIHLEFEEGC